jgi:hypothetical protein
MAWFVTIQIPPNADTITRIGLRDLMGWILRSHDMRKLNTAQHTKYPAHNVYLHQG